MTCKALWWNLSAGRNLLIKDRSTRTLEASHKLCVLHQLPECLVILLVENECKMVIFGLLMCSILLMFLLLGELLLTITFC